MTEQEARQILATWEPKADKLNFTNGVTFTDYHIDRIKRENGGAWDDTRANEYITSLVWELKGKYGDE